MTPSYPSASTLGAIIRRQRELAELPMRQLAAAVGISNPYLSQIERGLRAPSDAVLNAIADSLQTTAEALFSEAGYVPAPSAEHPGEGSGLEAAIDAAQELTPPQRRALAEVYQAFRAANTLRRVRGEPTDDAAPDEAPDQAPGHDAPVVSAAGVPIGRRCR